MHDKIIVGVDGSAGAEHALRWAVDEADRRHAKVVVLHAFDVNGPAGLYSGAVFDEESVQESGQEILDQAVAHLGPEAPAGLELRCVRGTASKALIDAGEEADLVVVGTRGLGGFGRLLLGSVSSQLAHHAPCPVVIVPPAG
jgi:nucleotide-binding universal stress UspA family protein